MHGNVTELNALDLCVCLSSWDWPTVCVCRLPPQSLGIICMIASLRGVKDQVLPHHQTLLIQSIENS